MSAAIPSLLFCPVPLSLPFLRYPYTSPLLTALNAGGGDAAGGSGGAGAGQLVEFSQIDRTELGRLQSYFVASKIKVCWEVEGMCGMRGAGLKGFDGSN